MGWLCGDGNEFAIKEYRSRKEAIEAAKFNGFTQIGKAKPMIFSVSARDVIKKAIEDADEEVGDFLFAVPPTKERDLERKLSAIFNQWLKDNNLETWFCTITNVEDVE